MKMGLQLLMHFMCVREQIANALLLLNPNVVQQMSMLQIKNTQKTCAINMHTICICSSVGTLSTMNITLRSTNIIWPKGILMAETHYAGKY